MNSKQAKEIDLTLLLSHLGQNPVKRTNKYDMYNSILRSDDKDASFVVYKHTNLWIDFGTGLRGTTIDLIMQLKQCDFKDALDFLNSNFSEFKNITPYENFVSEKQTEENEKSYTIDKIEPLKNRILINYLKDRNISEKIAKKYCKEIYWKNSCGKKLFAIAFENDSQGYSIRNAFYKRDLLKKDISFIDNASKNIKVFEGFIDFLSYLSDKGDLKDSNYLVLNSVSSVYSLDRKEKLYEILNTHEKIECFLDNDKAGKEALSKIKHHFFDKVEDKSGLFEAFNDYNDYLTNKIKIKR